MTVRDIPPKYKKMYRKAMTGRSRKAATRIFCLECVMYSETEVHRCTDTGCPLYIHIDRVRRNLSGQLPPNIVSQGQGKDR